MSAENTGNVKAALDAFERLHGVKPIEGVAGVGAGELVALPDGMKVHDLKPNVDARRTAPERIKGTARLSTLLSFTDHVKRFADKDSAIFAAVDPKTPKLVAVFDYHGVRPDGDPTGRTARFATHRAEYAFPLSSEWQAWAKIDGHEMPLPAFAEMLEERIADVIDPASIGEGSKDVANVLGITLATAAALLVLSRGLSLRVDAKVSQAVNLSSGEASISFEETHAAKDGGALKVPNGFALGIPVFRDGTVYSIVARLRYRVSGGSVLWRIALHRPDAAFDDAFRGACAEAEKDTGTPLFYGTPEA